MALRSALRVRRGREQRTSRDRGRCRRRISRRMRRSHRHAPPVFKGWLFPTARAPRVGPDNGGSQGHGQRTLRVLPAGMPRARLNSGLVQTPAHGAMSLIAPGSDGPIVTLRSFCFCAFNPVKQPPFHDSQRRVALRVSVRNGMKDDISISFKCHTTEHEI